MAAPGCTAKLDTPSLQGTSDLALQPPSEPLAAIVNDLLAKPLLGSWPLPWRESLNLNAILQPCGRLTLPRGLAHHAGPPLNPQTRSWWAA